MVYVGDSEFIVVCVFSEILDQGFSVFNIDFMVLIVLEDMEKINIIGLGSCVVYKVYFVGDILVIDSYYDWFCL